LKVYVAAKFENKEEVRAVYALLLQAGHTITVDWTVEPGEGDLGSEDYHKLQEEWAIKDAQGVIDCDVLVMLPHDRSKGAYAELGMAIALGKKSILVLPEKPFNCVFFHHPLVGWVPDFSIEVARHLALIVEHWETNRKAMTARWKPEADDDKTWGRNPLMFNAVLPHSHWLRIPWTGSRLEAQLAAKTGLIDPDNFKLTKSLRADCNTGHTVIFDIGQLEDLRAGSPEAYQDAMRVACLDLTNCAVCADKASGL